MSSTVTGHSALKRAVRELGLAGIEDARAEARIVLAHALGVALSQLDLHLRDPLPPEVAQSLATLVRERASRRPLAYVLGETEFMGLRFKCDERALAPRPETEVLVEEVEKRVARDARGHVLLDVGAGAGAIGLSLAVRLPGLRVILTDVSADALALAKQNAELLGIADRVRWLEGPGLTPVVEAALGAEITVLASNPPYIAPRDVPGLPPEVALHEPELAWRGEGEEGLACHQGIVSQGRALLPILRLVAFEVGLGQAPAVAELCRGAWPSFAVSIVRDLSGIDRVVLGEAARG
jgi:release factor glutamine methyltransferase